MESRTRVVRRRERLLERVARLGFFGRIARDVRRNVLLMESDSEDDYDTDDEDNVDEVGREGEGSAWSNRVGNSREDELERMITTLTSARDLAREIGGSEESVPKEVAEEASVVESVGTMLNELGKTGAAMFMSGHVEEDSTSAAGLIFADVSHCTSLKGVFVRVRIESGRKLLAMDSGETSDPYVKVSIANSSGVPITGQVHRTGYRPKTLNPVWDESFYMGHESLKLKECSIRIDVYDYDIMSADDHMGYAVLPLNIFNTGTEKNVPRALKPERVDFDHGHYVELRPSKLSVCFKLQQPKKMALLVEEARAMLAFAKTLINPRNIGKSLSQSGIGSWFNSKIEQAMEIGKRKALRIIDTTIEEKKKKVSQLAVADRDMPQFVKGYLSGVINMYINDIQTSFMSELSIRMKILESAKTQTTSLEAKALDRRVRKKHNGVRGRIGAFFDGIRCWYLYNEVPQDKSIFGKVRNPYWWIFLFAKLYYGLGFQALIFFIRLALVDKRDEWQMFEFIMVFKGIQFVSGTISVFVGVFAFIECAGVIDSGMAHTCNTRGPWVTDMESCAIGTSNCVKLNVASYGMRIIMCWYAFHKLKNSFAFGRAIAGDTTLVGGTVMITVVRPGSKFKTANSLAACFNRLTNRRSKEKPIDRFRRIVDKQLDVIARERSIRGGTGRSNGLRGFHYVQRHAKVKAYDEGTGLHTIYYKDDKSKTKTQVDLSATTYTVVKLKNMSPRRLQRILFCYELITFVITAACTLQFLHWIDWGKGQTWQIYGVAFWAQTLYNLLAFPFILTVVPGLNKFICHAPKTGYDRQGYLRQFKKRSHFEQDITDEPSPRSRCLPMCYPFIKTWRV